MARTKGTKNSGPKKLGPGKKDGRKVKYTLKWAITEVEWMHKFITSEDEGRSVLLISELCEKRGYSKNRWSEACSKYSAVVRLEGESDLEFKHRKAKHEHFLDCLDRVKTIFHNRLLKGALVKKFDSPMSRFILVNHYGYKSESIETATLGKDGVPVDPVTPQAIFIIPSNNRDNGIINNT